MAQAGLEDIPLSSVTDDLPYVVKSPWSYQLALELLNDPVIRLDGVIIPIRDIREAAASRVVRQLQAIHQEMPWMTRTTTWEHWGGAPGGVIYSLNPIDQARLLAIGFHQLLNRLVQVDVPIVLLAFPRFVEDSDYLHHKVAPLLPVDLRLEQTRAIHAMTFSNEKIRIGQELKFGNEILPVSDRVQGPDYGTLDNAALKRELSRLRDQISELTAERDTSRGSTEALQDEIARLGNQSIELSAERDALRAELASLSNHFGELTAERDALRGKTEALQDEFARQAVRVSEFEVLAEHIQALHQSRSWRFTSPVRALGYAVRAGLRPLVGRQMHNHIKPL
ncbi:MAG TPA: hypothetical protein VFL55_13320 [Acetobacteraceae bacterium]|nr:hypothetical protein [Acetobacteraceae bacterium]